MSSLELLSRPVVTVPRLPPPPTGWGAREALQALAEARPCLPFLSSEPAVVSALSTVVLRAGEHAVKVYPPGTDPAHLDRLARELAGSVTAVGSSSSPVVTRHGVVTVAPWLPAVGVASWAEVGTLLRAFHVEHTTIDVPRWTPLSRLAAQVETLPARAAAVLLEARSALLDALADVRSELGEGVIHGDVSPSNVLRTPAGPRLIDLDWVARAPLEYDLTSAARRLRDGEISVEAYSGFCEAYGFDVRTWPGLPVLDRIAELGAVGFGIWDCRHHGRDLAWLEHELPRWRAPL